LGKINLQASRRSLIDGTTSTTTGSPSFKLNLVLADLNIADIEQHLLGLQSLAFADRARQAEGLFSPAWIAALSFGKCHAVSPEAK